MAKRLNYESLSPALRDRITEDRRTGNMPKRAFKDENAVRRHNRAGDVPTVWRGPFIKDIDKIMHCPFYCRYADKTQVFSVYRDIDISRRVLHVQLVSRIARTIGECLNLNLNLIEAVSLGHDIGHSPFGHIGERIIDEISREKSGIRFSHNVHSVRVLDRIFPYNITLQTLCGIASHDGEMELMKYQPQPPVSFREFDGIVSACEKDKANLSMLVPHSLEDCVVRISDIIAYLGKDRQDAEKAGYSIDFSEGSIGTLNAEIINNLIVNIIENSYDKPYIAMDEEHFSALKRAKEENYRYIYEQRSDEIDANNVLRPMFGQLYEKLYDDLVLGKESSPVFNHHIRTVENIHYARSAPYREENPHRIVVDFLASMTDTYFSEIHAFFFPKSGLKIRYRNYFSSQDS